MSGCVYLVLVAVLSCVWEPLLSSFFFMGAVDWGLHYVKRLIFLGGRVGAGQYQNFFVLAWGLPLSGGGGEGEPLLASLKGGGMGGARLGLGLPLSGDGSLVAVFLVLAWKGEAEFCVLLEEKVQFTSK